MESDELSNNGPPVPARISRMRRFPLPPNVENVLPRYQLASAKAHAKVLVGSGIINGEMADRIIEGLDQIGKEFAAGTHFLKDDDIDLYTALLRRLSEISGTLAERLNQGRSDEDWLAVDVRVWVRDTILHVLSDLANLRTMLLQLAATHEDVLLPAYAHMQPKRKEMLCFYFLSCESRLRQDGERFRDLFRRVNLIPAGLDNQVLLEHPLDRGLLARLLGFDGIQQNSFDSVSEIDFVIEFASCAAILGTHLSQFAGEMLLWSTQEFGYVRLPRNFSLENEAFPDRKSSEILELLRSRSASLGYRLTEILNQLKGIPSFSSHESNEVLTTLNQLIYNCDFVLELTKTILPALVFDTKKMSEVSETDMANRANAIDYLIEKGFMPDKAVALVEPLVEYCRKRKRTMSDLAPGEWSQFSPAFDRDIYKYVSKDESLGLSGPRYELVSQAIDFGRQQLNQDQEQLAALLSKVKSLTVEVPSTTE